MWDDTCVDTLAPSHLPRTSVEAAAAADLAEDLKRRKYAGLDRAYLFARLGVETLGPWRTETLRVFKILSGRPRSGEYLPIWRSALALLFSVAMQPVSWGRFRLALIWIS